MRTQEHRKWRFAWYLGGLGDIRAAPAREGEEQRACTAPSEAGRAGVRAMAGKHVGWRGLSGGTGLHRESAQVQESAGGRLAAALDAGALRHAPHVARRSVPVQVRTREDRAWEAPPRGASCLENSLKLLMGGAQPHQQCHYCQIQ